MSLITLIKTFLGSTSYASDHETNYTSIESVINALGVSVASAISPLAMPPILAEIYDRNGIIGEASYFPDDNGGVALPSNNLTIAAGAYWSGSDYRNILVDTTVAMGAFSTGTLYVNVPTGGVPTVTSSAGADTVWQFAYNQGTDIVTAVALYSTADILFDGDDYNGMLGSYMSVTDRIAAIEAAVGVLGEYYAEDSAAHSGLNFGYKTGKVRDDNVVTTTAASTILLTNATTNYVEVTPSTGVVSKNTLGFTSGKIALFTVVTAGGLITVVTDKRTWAISGGGGGGHTQNTDTGTDSDTFTLNNTEAGVPSLNGSFAVERGSSPNVDIRWNETTDKWEFTTDGSTYTEMGGVSSEDLAVQGFTKYVALEEPEMILENIAASTDVDYIQLDIGPTGLNVITDAPNGVTAVVLRVQFWDSAPGSGVHVEFRKYGSALVPLKSYTVWGGANEEDDVGTLVIPGDNTLMDTLGFEYYTTASGAGTANVRVFLLGYYIRVTGVGTQRLALSSAGNVAVANTTTQFNKVGFANRALVYNLTLTETGALNTGLYDIYIYSKDTFLAADLIYEALSIDPALNLRVYNDRLPFFYTDDDETAELHIKIVNHDVTQNGTFTIAVTCEQFA